MPPRKVVVVGAGIAGLEALTCLGGSGGDELALTLIAPEHEFRLRPLAAAGGFVRGDRLRWPIDELAAHAGADVVHDSVVYVDDEEQTVLTHDGDWISFDALLVAAGARTSPALERGIAWDRDAGHGALEALLRDVERGQIRSAAFVVPDGPGWPVPAYELALTTAATARGTSFETTLLTAEPAPLAQFGREASRLVDDELARAGVRVLTGVTPALGDGPPLTIDTGAVRLTVDQVVALPRVTGPRIHGVAADARSFHPAGHDGRVEGMRSVFVAGDASDLALKHSTLSVQQAEAAAATIAGDAPVADAEAPRLHGIVAARAWKRAEELAGPKPAGARTAASLWWPPTVAAGPHLSALLLKREPGLRIGTTAYPDGVAVDIAVPHLRRDPQRDLAEPAALRDERARAARHRAAEWRKLESIERLEREAEAEERSLERELEAFDSRRAEVVRRLERDGYLQHRHGR